MSHEDGSVLTIEMLDELKRLLERSPEQQFFYSLNKNYGNIQTDGSYWNEEKQRFELISKNKMIDIWENKK